MLAETSKADLILAPPAPTLRPPVVTIRTVRDKDIPELLGLIGALALHHGEQATLSEEDLARDLFGPSPWISGLVAVSGGELIGFALMSPLYLARQGQRGLEINQIFVKSGFRGQGIGQHLVDRAREQARASGCAFLSVGAATGNFRAHRFYEHLDFAARPVTGMRYLKAIG